MAVEATIQCAKYRKEWRALVHKYIIEFQSGHFKLPDSFVFSDGPSELWWLATYTGVGRCDMLLLG